MELKQPIDLMHLMEVDMGQIYKRIEDVAAALWLYPAHGSQHYWLAKL